MLNESSRIAVIRHLAFEDLGSFAPLLESQGYSFDYYDAGVDEIQEPIEHADLLIVMGGPIGVYEHDRYPFLTVELQALKSRLAHRRPTLGICLGAQLIAAALGARVYPGPVKEIGWGLLQLTESGRASCLAALEGVPVLHWHGDTFDLPDGAQRLASNEHYPNQAFALGQTILGIQCHAEVDPVGIERWLIGHCCELSQVGIEPDELRRRTLEVSRQILPAAEGVLKNWLEQLV
ncbi:MAG: glutamine amidotransferase [Candidatus Thiodiazotropha sp.]